MTCMDKRNKLVYAITHNVQYLAQIHKQNATELKTTQEKLRQTSDENESLKAKNIELEKKCSELEKDQIELAKKREEINKMVIESQANADEIASL